MKRSIVILAIFLFLVAPVCTSARETDGDSIDGMTHDRFMFIAINPGAALSLVNAGFVVHTVLPTALFGQEAGLSLGLGMYQNHAFPEIRVSIGNSNAYYLLLQTQISWNWFFAESFGWFNKGPYAGVGVRYWDLVQIHAGIHNHNGIPLINLGWWFDIGRVFIDVRLSQVIAIASVSSLEYSVPGFDWIFSPLPGISPWMPIGMIQVGMRI